MVKIFNNLLKFSNDTGNESMQANTSRKLVEFESELEADKGLFIVVSVSKENYYRILWLLVNWNLLN